MDEDRAGSTTRRQLLAGALAVGGLLASAPQAQAQGEAQPPSDVDLLTVALGYERLSVISYEHVLTQPPSGLDETVLRLMRRILAQERAHVRALERDLLALGGNVAATPPAPQAVGQALAAHHMSGDLAKTGDLKSAVQLLLDVEALCEGAYFTAVGKLSDGRLITLCAQALGCEAQHSTLLTGLLPKADITESVPYWYVTGVT